ncbi:MAG: hypothetical protein ACKO2Z_11615, partial [Sphaerospermopsis kisseleviana]
LGLFSKPYLVLSVTMETFLCPVYAIYTRRVWMQCGFDFDFGRKQVNKKIPDFLKKSGSLQL